jgi:molybdopterin molybdotransferase
MISVREARDIIRENMVTVGPVTIAAEQAAGRVLAEEVSSADDIPPFDNSAMDGFAVRAADIVSVPQRLHLSDIEIPAGTVPSRPLRPGEAMRIMTGSPLPQGADAVVPQEWTLSNEESVVIERQVDPGSNIRPAGNDVAKGSRLFPKGRFLGASELGLLASLGRRFVRVSREPGVALLSTGNELVEPDAHTQPPGTIRNSNAVSLAALVRQCSALPNYLGIARDDLAGTVSRVAEGLRSDMLVTSGGVSVGKFDYVHRALEELHVGVRFWKVNMKPGMPLLFGVAPNGVPVFCLPGNPVSSVVTFLQFVRPALWQMAGRESFAPFFVRARLQQELTKSDGKYHFARGIVTRSEDGAFDVILAGSQISNVLTSMVRANCLIHIPEEVSVVHAGDLVETELLDMTI